MSSIYLSLGGRFFREKAIFVINGPNGNHQNYNPARVGQIYSAIWQRQRYDMKYRCNTAMAHATLNS